MNDEIRKEFCNPISLFYSSFILYPSTYEDFTEKISICAPLHYYHRHDFALRDGSSACDCRVLYCCFARFDFLGIGRTFDGQTAF